MKKVPYAPRFLDEAGKRYWRDYCRGLQQVNALFEADLSALEDLCYLEQQKEQVRERLAKGKLINDYFNDEGQLKYSQQSPEFSMLKTLQIQINELRKRFGLDPRSRGGLVVHRESAMTSLNPFMKSKPNPRK